MFEHLKSKLGHEQTQYLNDAIGSLQKSGFLDLILEESESKLRMAALQAAGDSGFEVTLRDTARQYATVLGIIDSLLPKD